MVGVICTVKSAVETTLLQVIGSSLMFCLMQSYLSMEWTLHSSSLPKHKTISIITRQLCSELWITRIQTKLVEEFRFGCAALNHWLMPWLWSISSYSLCMCVWSLNLTFSIMPACLLHLIGVKNNFLYYTFEKSLQLTESLEWNLVWDSY